MSPLSNSPVPTPTWGPEVLEAVRATPAPLYALALPVADHSGWTVSLIQKSGSIRDAFHALDLEEADRELHRRGYLSMASAMGRDWERLSAERGESRRGTPVFRHPDEAL